MKTLRLFALCGTLVFGAGAGCGGYAGQADSAVTSVVGSDVASGSLALAEGEDRLADDGGSRKRPDVSRLKELLGLSDEQVTKIQAIEQSTRDALAAIRQQVKDGAITKDEAHAQAKALRDDQKAQVLAVLTAEQQAKFAELRAQHGRPFDLDRLTTLLGLSADQVTQIQTIVSDTKTKVNDIRSQVESGALSADDARAQIKALLDAQLAAIKGVLTADQLAKLQAAAPNGDERPHDCGPRDGGGPGSGGGGGPGAPRDGGRR